LEGQSVIAFFVAGLVVSQLFTLWCGAHLTSDLVDLEERLEAARSFSLNTDTETLARLKELESKS
jgi:hypothetical protein